MEILSIESKDKDLASRRDIFLGPQKIFSSTYGVSLILPRGWIAASVSGELYGIEPLARNDGRIYVTGRVANTREIIQSHTKLLDLGFVKLHPISMPLVDRNQVSVHCTTQGVGPYKHTFVTTAITPRNKAVTFTAFFDEPAAFMLKSVSTELADSVRDLTPL